MMALKVSGGGIGMIPEAPSVSGSLMLDVKGLYEVDPATPLPYLDSQPAVAYHCVHKRNPERALYALVCDPKLPPRLDIVRIVKAINHPHLLRALDWDVVDWATEGRRCPVIILERPEGERVFKDLTHQNKPMPEELIIKHFIEPACQIMLRFHDRGATHRMIRPDNLFWMDSEKRSILIGECFSSPPGIANSIAYETLECGLSSVAGRGEGSVQNDLYAVGVTILALLTGQSPMAGKEDDEIVSAKLMSGSYGAYAKNYRISLTMMEPLRGLLNDDASERWSLEELSAWVNGRRLSPKQSAMPVKAARALSIAGNDYTTAREVAHAMHRNWEQAVTLIESGDLDNWLRRSLGVDDRVEAVNIARSTPIESKDKLVARVLIALDPEGPIRLKEFAGTIEGVSTLLGAFVSDMNARRLFTSLMNMGLVHFWMGQQHGRKVHHVLHMTKLDGVLSILGQEVLGLGIERVAYELNANLPCQSPLFARDFVPLVEFILPALERVCAQQDPPGKLIDAHIAAFLGVHFKRPLGSEFRAIENEWNSEEGRIAQVRIFAALQSALHHDVKFPHLCTLSVSLLDTAIERFHSRETRKKIAARLLKASKSGRLQDLLDIIDNRREVTVDKDGFEKASKDYYQRIHDLIDLERDIMNKPKLAEEIGDQVSMGIAMSGCLATVVFSGFLSII